MGQTSNWIISNQAFKLAPNPCLSGSSQPQQRSPWQPPWGREEAGAALGPRQIATPCRAILLSRVNIALSSSCPVFFFFFLISVDFSFPRCEAPPPPLTLLAWWSKKEASSWKPEMA